MVLIASLRPWFYRARHVGIYPRRMRHVVNDVEGVCGLTCCFYPLHHALAWRVDELIARIAVELFEWFQHDGFNLLRHITVEFTCGGLHRHHFRNAAIRSNKCTVAKKVAMPTVRCNDGLYVRPIHIVFALRRASLHCCPACSLQEVLQPSAGVVLIGSF